MSTPPAPSPPATDRSGPALDDLLGIADDALLAAQWLGGWIAEAPVLEEDVALANIALDQLGVARALLAHVGELEGAGRGEDDLAYWRGPEEFRNALLVERPDKRDFAVLVVRLLLLSTAQLHRYAALRSSPDPVVAAVATRAVTEVSYHRDHARGWLLRLGDGTPESHDRVQAALDAEWPYLAEVLEPTTDEEVRAVLTRDIADATLRVPADPPNPTPYAGGRTGWHTPHLTAVLEELQQVARAHPGASW